MTEVQQKRTAAERRQARRRTVKHLLTGLAIGAVLQLAFRLRSLITVPSGTATKVLVTVGIIAVGCGLYWLRCTRRVMYALLELGFGMATAWTAVGIAWNGGLAAYGAVGGSVYLIVRGLDNLDAGFIEQQKAARQQQKAARQARRLAEANLAPSGSREAVAETEVAATEENARGKR
jgi:hypothetical protein